MATVYFRATGFNSFNLSNCILYKPLVSYRTNNRRLEFPCPQRIGPTALCREGEIEKFDNQWRSHGAISLTTDFNPLLHNATKENSEP